MRWVGKEWMKRREKCGVVSIVNQKMNRNSWKHTSSKLFDRSSSSSVFIRTKDCSGRETPLERTFFKDASNAPSLHGKSKTKPQKAAKHSNKSSLIGLTPQCSMTSTPKLSLARSTKLKENNFTSIFAGRHADTPAAEKKQRNRNDYKFIYQIGSGGFGSVWKVREKQTNIIYAMKEISKAKVILKKSVASVINEKVLLDQLCSRFIINVNQSFQDRDYLYLAMEYLRGGDLRYHMCYHDYFSEEQTKFIVACIIISLEYIHSQKIIHRDLKPENLVFQENGYLRLTDFGVARKWVANNASETSGTPGYMAPEVICRINHSFESDFFALGVIVFEMIVGQRPYTGDSRKQIRDKIVAHQAKIVDENVPPSWNRNVLDFVNKLLKRTKQSRLGYNGIQQLKDHPWLSSINWKKLARQEIPAPFFPGIVSESAEYQREMESSLPTELDQETMMLLRTQEVQNLFKTYDQPKKKDSKNPLRRS